MRRAEPLEPEVVAALEAIDATLHGEPVDPEHAELAELSLILADERPEPDSAFLRELDARVSGRFAPEQPRPRRVWWGAATGFAVAAAAALAIIVVHVGSRPGTSSNVSSSAAASGAGAASSAGPARSAAPAASSSAPAASPTTHGPGGSVPAPRTGSHRQVVQSAQLTLTAGTGRIDAVAQEVFDVIGAEHGIVAGSDVRARTRAPSTARFELRVPSARLQATLTRLSRLRGAQVTSRRDASSDITGQVGGAGRRLAQARALQRSLLRQLAAAVSTTEVDRLKTALGRNGAAIARDERSLAGLHARVAYSAITVSVTAPAARSPRLRHGGAFTLGRALHDAGRVLVVAAGVGLIALAVLIPLGLVTAVAAWVWAIVLRRRREDALGR